MRKQSVNTEYVTRSENCIQAITDLLCNAKSKMVTVEFTKSDGARRTINGMINTTAKGMTYNPFERGLIPVNENIIVRNEYGQCKTVLTQFRMINLCTVSRIAFNKKVYEFIN